MLTHVFLSPGLALPSLSPKRGWARSHFYFFAWVDNCNPRNKLWLLLVFFFLKYSALPSTKTGPKSQGTAGHHTHRDRLQFIPSTIIFRQTIITNLGKQGKRSPCSPALQNSKIASFGPNTNKTPQLLVLTARKANALTL